MTKYLKNSSTYHEVKREVLEQLIKEYKDCKLSLMYEGATWANIDERVREIEAEINEYRRSLDLPDDPNESYCRGGCCPS